MRFSSPLHTLRVFSAAFILFSIVAVTAVPAAASTETRGRAAEVTVTGSTENGEKPFIILNGENVLSGRTFFSGSLLETPQTSSANVSLPGLGRVMLSPGTKMDLGFTENSITGRITAGRIKVSAAEGVRVNIESPDNAVKNDPSTASSFTLDLASGTSRVYSDSGSIVTENGAPEPQVQTAPASASIWIPVTMFAVIVGVAATAVIIDRSDDDDAADVIISPVR